MDDRVIIARQVLLVMPVLFRRVGCDFRTRFPDVDPAHFGILMSLKQRPCTVSELSQRHVVSMATMSKSVGTLEDRGWIRRKPYSGDRRRVELSLSGEGSAQVDCMYAHLENRIRFALSHLTDDEVRSLGCGMEVLVKLLSDAINLESDPRSGLETGKVNEGSS